MYVAIISQSIQSAKGLESNLAADEALVANYVIRPNRCGAYDDSSSRGATPVLTKLLYVVQRGTKVNNRQERVQVDGCINHVCGLLKLPVNQGS
eukprot:6410038-Amphidinium_carterae.1